MTDILLTQEETNLRQETRALIDLKIDPGLVERMGSEKNIRKMGRGGSIGVIFNDDKAGDQCRLNSPH